MADLIEVDLCVECGVKERDALHIKDGSGRARCKSCRQAWYRKENESRRRPRRRRLIWGHLKPHLAPTRTPTNLDIAWAAGIFEGEGCVSRASKKSSAIAVRVTQKAPWLCDRLRDLFGGHVGCYVKGEPSAPGSYSSWMLYGPRGRGFLLTTYSFLSPRRQQRIRELLNLERS